eukprot:SAG25_NODE_5543_length_646_cov_0.661792_1_plen_78_part_10
MFMETSFCACKPSVFLRHSTATVTKKIEGRECIRKVLIHWNPHKKSGPVVCIDHGTEGKCCNLHALRKKNTSASAHQF